MVRTPGRTFELDFQQWWTRYPLKVGKLAAQKAYDRVRRGGITCDELLDGIADYIVNKPSYADFCHPTTWLNQGRWMDALSTRTNLYEPWLCPHEPRCPHRAACAIVAARDS